MVSFKHQHCDEFRGPLVWLAREAATFEIQSPAMMLHDQERLEDFKIFVDGVAIYRGRAVVQQIISGGATKISHVELDDAGFSDEYLATLTAAAEEGGSLDRFLELWGEVYRLRKEFKVILADIHTFLSDLRRHLEVQEVGLTSLPQDERAQKESRLLAKITPTTNQALDELFERFELFVSSLSDAEKPIYRDYAQRMLHSLVLWAPFSDRSYRKPLGYAGDHEMVAMMFREHREGTSLYAKVFNVWLLHQDSSLAHQNRVTILEARLATCIAKVHGMGRRANVLNIGCGPAVEVQRLIANSPLSDHLDITLLDFNDKTLAQTGAQLRKLKQEHGRTTTFEAVTKSVQQLLKDSAGKKQIARYDMVYCAGLFDYMPDKICERLLGLFYQQAVPGGAVLATNVTPKNPNRASMEFALDWYLIYRDAQAMRGILPQGITGSQAHICSDLTGTNIFLEFSKPHAT